MSDDSRTIIQAAVKELYPHDANMRRLYPVGPMAELTMQMVARGYDRDKPMLVQKIKKGQYRIIRGHRRRMAYVMANHLLANGDGGDLEIEQVLDAWEVAVDEHGSVQHVIDALLADEEAGFGANPVPVVVFNGDYKEGLAALWSDNFGEDKPDLLGSAHSFKAGMQAGYSPRQIAGQVGQSVHYVSNLVALADLDQRLAERIARGELGLSLCSALNSLPHDKREGATRFILKQESSMLTVTRLVAAIRKFNNWSGFDVPALVDVQAHRNVARAMVHLWNDLVSKDVFTAHEGAFTYFYNHADEEYQPPYRNVDLLKGWLVALGVISITQYSTALQAIGRYLPVEEVSCESCPVWGLPDEILTNDLNSPMLACRSRSLRSKVQNCLHGLAPSDPFHVRVPATWSQLPGVKGADTPRPFVDSYEDLLAAYEARAEIEEKRRAEENRIRNEQEKLSEKRAEAAASADDGGDEQSEPAGPRPVDVMRGQISAFIALSDLMDGKEHFMAATCDDCAHRLDASPVQDETVPHCAWASQLRNISFEQIVSIDPESTFPPIPICRQYQPRESLAQIIPEYPGVPEIPRHMMIAMIKRLVMKGNNHNRMPFEWVAGVPMGSNDNRKDWMKQIVEADAGDLSDGQVFFLFLLAIAEEERCQQWGGDGQFYVPESESNPFRWIRVKQERWNFEV